MQGSSAKLPIALTLVVLAFASCAQRSQLPVSTLGEDDDAICRANNVVVGSSEYIACRKDRDVLRNNAAARADRRQRNLGEYMLNHPDHP
jgi:DICT domain-containing protein